MLCPYCNSELVSGTVSLSTNAGRIPSPHVIFTFSGDGETKAFAECETGDYPSAYCPSCQKIIFAVEKGFHYE